MSSLPAIIYIDEFVEFCRIYNTISIINIDKEEEYER